MPMPDIAEAFTQAFTHGDAGALAALLLHRARMEDGLRLLIGRDAVIAEALALAGAGADRAAVARLLPSQAPATGWALLTLDMSLTIERVPEPLGLGETAPVQAGLRRHLWLRREAGRIAEITAVTGWGDLADALGIAGEAAAHGFDHPAVPALGELASGRGQLAAADPFAFPAFSPAGRFVAIVNARRLGALPAAARDAWLHLLARAPDAHVTLDHAVSDGAATACLWRLQGHVVGADGALRRVSLPGSTLLTTDGDAITTADTLFDDWALAASAHRPFHPE